MTKEPLVINEVAENMDQFVNHFKDNEGYKLIEETEDKVVFKYDSDEFGGELLYPFDEWIMFNIEQDDIIEIMRVDTEEETWRRALEYQHPFWPWRKKDDKEYNTVEETELAVESDLTGFMSNITKDSGEPVQELDFMSELESLEDSEDKTEVYKSWQAEISIGDKPQIIPINDVTLTLNKPLILDNQIKGDQDDETAEDDGTDES